MAGVTAPPSQHCGAVLSQHGVCYCPRCGAVQNPRARPLAAVRRETGAQYVGSPSRPPRISRQGSEFNAGTPYPAAADGARRTPVQSSWTASPTVTMADRHDRSRPDAHHLRKCNVTSYDLPLGHSCTPMASPWAIKGDAWGSSGEEAPWANNSVLSLSPELHGAQPNLACNPYYEHFGAR